MSDLAVKENTTIVIEKDKGLTHALRDLVKKNPNSILSDGKITAKEWNAVFDKLIDINNARKANNQKPIFTGGTDKSRAGWHSSFVVHPNQKIEFTPEEMAALYTAMGVTFKETKNDKPTENSSENKGSAEKPVEKPEIQRPDSVKTKPADADSTKVQAPAAKDSVPEVKNDSKAEAKTDSVNVSETTPETSTKSRYELSWKEIGKIGLKSAKKFIKGMFCDENGFSLKRTAMTVGVVAGLALAAPAAAALGASAAVVGGVALTAKVVGLGLAGYMAYNGGKNAIQGGTKYYESTTEEEAKANMEQAMDGAVELTAALPVFLTIKGGANKGNKMASKKGEGNPSASETPAAEPKPAAESKPLTEITPPDESVPAPEVKPAAEKPAPEFDFSVPETKPALEIKPEPEIKPAQEPKVTQDTPSAETPKSEPNVSNPAPKVEPKPAEEVKPAEAPKSEAKPNEAKPAEPVDYSTRIEIVRTKNGFKIERHRNADGKISRDVVFDNKGKYSYTKEFQYTSDGAEAGYTFNWANGAKDVFKTGANQGVRTKADGTQWIIKKEGTKIVEVEQIKPNAETSAPEAKPAEPNVETKPAQETLKTEQKPVDNIVVDYNKAVCSEVKKNVNGGTDEYFYNEAGKVVKSISRDKDGNITGQAVTEYNANGEQIKWTNKHSNGAVFEHFYEKGLETKKTIKWNDGISEELTPIGENFYEGVRTYPDGRKVRIRQENYEITELGPVETPKAGEIKPAAETKPAGSKEVSESYVSFGPDGVMTLTDTPAVKFKQTAPNQGTFELNIETEGIISEHLSVIRAYEGFADIQFNYDKGAFIDAIKILKPGKVEMVDGKWVVTEKMQLELYKK